VLGKLRKHHGLVAFVLDEDVARGLDEGIEGAERSDEVPVRQHLVAEAPAIAARVAIDFPVGAGVLDQFVVALDDLEAVGRPYPELHRGTGLLPTLSAVAPASQGRVSRHLTFKRTAHARPLARRHAWFIRDLGRMVAV